MRNKLAVFAIAFVITATGGSFLRPPLFTRLSEFTKMQINPAKYRSIGHFAPRLPTGNDDEFTDAERADIERATQEDHRHQDAERRRIAWRYLFTGKTW